MTCKNCEAIDKPLIYGYIACCWRGNLAMESAQARLSGREIEVVELVVLGYPTREIADLLVISPDTAKTHLKNIFRKCEVHNRAQLAVWWCNGAALPAPRSRAVGCGSRHARAKVRPRKLLLVPLALAAVLIATLSAIPHASNLQKAVAPDVARATYVDWLHDRLDPIDRVSLLCDQVRQAKGGTTSYFCPLPPPTR